MTRGRSASWSTSSYAALQKIAADLHAAGDRGLTNSVRREMRAIGRPVGEQVLVEGAEKMPHAGGLSDRIQRTKKVGVSVQVTGRRVAVYLNLRGGNPAKSYELRRIDATGRVRHPVHGHQSRWVSQRVGPNAWTNAFQQKRPELARAVITAGQNVMDDIARGN